MTDVYLARSVAALLIAVPVPVMAQTSAPPPLGPFDPAQYVRIFEETPDGRHLLYEPPAKNQPPPEGQAGKTTLLRVDEDSKIIVEIMPDVISRDMVLNSIFMRALITRVATNATTAPVEVLNYSEVPKEPATQAMQAALALRTAADVRVVIQNLYNLAQDLVAVAYEDACSGPPDRSTNPASRPKGCGYMAKADAATRLREVLRASRPRVIGITTFFTTDSNALVLSVIGDRLFGLDLMSLRGVATKMSQDVSAIVEKEDTEALKDLDTNLRRLWDDMQQLRIDSSNPKYFDQEWDENVKPRLTRVLAPGTIDLAANKAADGETLTLTVQARAAGGAGAGGVSHDFQFAIRKLRPRITTEPSAFYVRRLGEIRNDKGEVVESNFSPAPGVTSGAVFYGRDRFLSVLAPGIGLNVSFMNFAASDFDPSIKNAAGQVVGGFKSTTSSTVQVGTGVTLSAFANALQFTYGWNLHVAKNRRYWGIGFGFLQIGEQIAKFAKK